MLKIYLVFFKQVKKLTLRLSPGPVRCERYLRELDRPRDLLVTRFKRRLTPRCFWTPSEVHRVISAPTGWILFFTLACALLVSKRDEGNCTWDLRSWGFASRLRRVAELDEVLAPSPQLQPARVAI